jgi:Tol biopolymer transport system component
MACVPWLLTWLSVMAAAAASASREPVLKQIRLPHAYYYREMYVPQVTSGPSSATWSPDGQELIYSMQGSLWRQRIGSTDATQLTSGDGYDYQPDWSPDGRHVVYAVYRNDAIELWLLDLTNGATRSILANGAVNVDPRWSPDGSRLAFVSTSHEGRWHVFIAPIDDGRLGASVRVTEDHDSGLPRYYYSVWDHYLSPSWSPDRRELTFVSNRGHVWGTGGFWRMQTVPGTPAREIHYEETTWKARPDWSPDGKRIVYSSYLGRQWNQLWLVPAGGGDAFQLTYGDFDATAPRWSPDGSRVAFISNEDGNTSLWVLTVPGGSRTRVEAGKRQYRTPVGTLRLGVLDGSGTVMAARVSVFDASGKSYAPDDAWRHADEAFVRSERRFEYGYFHVNGACTLTLPAGQYVVEASRGPEFAIVRRELRVAPDESASVDLVLNRLADMPARGWWSGDLHVHMNYGGTYRNTPAQLKFQAQAEDLHVVENLIVNKEQRIPDIGYFQTVPDAVSDSRFILMHAEEFHTSFWGHTALLGLERQFLLPNYAGYANTAASSLIPTNTDVFDLAHAQGGLTAYAHPFDAKPDPSDVKESRALPIDVALGKLDYLEVMGFSDHLITSGIWYRLLNCGFRIPAGAGTDAFPNFASLRGPAGLLRVFARIGDRLDHGAFLAAIRRGRTFVTNAPLLEFALGRDAPADAREMSTPAEIGDELRLTAGRHRLQARVSLRSHIPIDHLEIVRNGVVVTSVPLDSDRMQARAVVPLEVDQSGWYIVRAYADGPRAPILDLYPFASTSPIYVTVADRPVRSRQDAEFFVKWIDRVRQDAEAHTGWNTSAERRSVLDLIAKARAEFERRQQ